MSLLRALVNNKLTAFFSATYRPYRVVILITTAALIAWSANYYVLSVKHQQTLEHIVDQYGENMAALATEQLTNSVLNNDAISSQAIAHTIALKIGISSVIVYDNTNQILAQSIKPTDNEKTAVSKEYTAPILSSENIIGSTSIVIDLSSFTENTDSPAELFWSELLVITGLLLCIIFCFIKDAMQPQKNKTTTPESPPLPETINYQSDESIENTTLTAAPQEPAIYLTITVHNIDTLYRQLNGELRQQQMELLERNMQHAISLYHGEKLIADNHTIILLFNESGKDNIANAIYSAQLLIALHQKCNKSMITMSGLIQESSKEKGLNHTLNNVRALLKDQSPYSNHIETAVIEKYQLDQRLTYKKVETESFSTEITGLTLHYQKLLDNQLAQLLQE
jgi:hypothetical protein